MKKQAGLSFYKKRKKLKEGVVREVFSWIFGITMSIVLAYTAVYCVGMRTSVVGISMEPTLYSGQQIFIDRFLYNITTPKYDDIIVFLPNGNEKSHYYVKRIVGLPGDSIQIIDGRLYVNGVKQDDDFDKIADAGIASQVILLGNDEYFVLGDNRNDSEDSRSGNIGPISDDSIVGKVWFKMGHSNSKLGLVK